MNFDKRFASLWALLIVLADIVLGGLCLRDGWMRYQACIQRVEANVLTREFDKLLGGDGKCDFVNVLMQGNYTAYGVAMLAAPPLLFFILFVMGFASRSRRGG